MIIELVKLECMEQVLQQSILQGQVGKSRIKVCSDKELTDVRRVEECKRKRMEKQIAGRGVRHENMVALRP